MKVYFSFTDKLLVIFKNSFLEKAISNSGIFSVNSVYSGELLYRKKNLEISILPVYNPSLKKLRLRISYYFFRAWNTSVFVNSYFIRIDSFEIKLGFSITK